MTQDNPSTNHPSADRPTVVRSAISGIAFLILGSLISFSAPRTVTGGGSSSCSYLDLSPVVFGSLAMMAGVAVLRQAKTSSKPTLNFVLAGLCLGLGLLLIVRGFGFIGGPCN